MIPAPKPGVNSPPRYKSQSKSEQMIITLTFIVHVKLGMTCTNDARVASLHGTHHHWLRAQKTYGGKQGTLVNKSK